MIKVPRKTRSLTSMRNDIERSRLHLERSFIESQAELLDRIVDRRSAYYDDVDQQYWSPVGANIDRDLTTPFYDEESLGWIRRRARWTAIHSPFAQNFLNNMTSYVIGKGHSYKITVKEGYDPKSYDQQRRIYQRFLDRLLKLNRWKKRQREHYRRCHRDGEVFIRIFHQDNGYTLFRSVDPVNIFTPTNWRQDPSATYGIKTDPDDVETVDWYFLGEDETAEDYEIQHRKINVDLDVKRGLSSLYCIGENLDRGRDLLRNMSVVAAMQAAIAMIRKHKNATTTAISNFVQNQATYRTTYPTTGETRNFKKMRPGTVLDSKDNIDYEFPSVGLNPAAPVAVLGAELRAVASSKSMPEYMIGSDASNANYSSTMVAESPAVKFFESEQEEQIEMDLELLSAAAEHAVNSGKLPADCREYCEIQVEAPVIVTRNDLEIAQSNDIYLRNRVKSPQTILAELGHKADKEIANWREYEDAMPDVAPLPLPSEM